jgi:hypothetical protein
MRTYTELSRRHTFEERFKYLKLHGNVGESTFGFDRYLNQRFYTSAEWRHLRHRVIARDNGCDLGIEGYEIHRGLYIHHMNVVQVEDLTDFNPDILDPEFLITCTHTTHNAIHYGDDHYVPRQVIERKPGDTKLW